MPQEMATAERLAAPHSPKHLRRKPKGRDNCPEQREQRWDFHGSRGPWGAIQTKGFSRQTQCPSGCSWRSHYAGG